jgi:hypothetical protein
MNEKKNIEELLIAMTMLMNAFTENLNIENEIGKLRLKDWKAPQRKNKGIDLGEEIDWPDDFWEGWE